MISGAFLALHFGLWVTSLSYTSVATSIIFVTATPIFVGVASYIFFKEELRRRTYLGIAISVIGAILIGYGNWSLGSDQLFGGALALLGALAIAGYLLIGRRLRRNMGLLSYISITYTTAAIFLLVATFVSGHSLIGYSGSTFVMFILLAVIPQLIGHSSLNWSLRFIPATYVTIAVLGEPIIAIGLAFLILNETPTVMKIAGGVLILAGIVIAFHKSGLLEGQN